MEYNDKQMQIKILKIASALLEDYANIKGGSICQDLPREFHALIDRLSDNEKQDIMKLHEEYNACESENVDCNPIFLKDAMYLGFAVSCYIDRMVKDKPIQPQSH